MLGLSAATQPASGRAGLVQKVWFHHARRDTELYCLKRNYWWFYRPYQTAKENYARCMPYFHYPQPASDRRPASSGFLK